MVRKVDEKKTRRALRRLERARKAAREAGASEQELSEWEGEFLGSLEERLEKFGSAFNDPDKGSTEEALSVRQAIKLKEIEKKAKGKARKPMSRGSGFKRKMPQRGGRARDINEDIDLPESATPEPEPRSAPEPRPASDAAALRARFRLIAGGRDESADD